MTWLAAQTKLLIQRRNIINQDVAVCKFLVEESRAEVFYTPAALQGYILSHVKKVCSLVEALSITGLTEYHRDMWQCDTSNIKLYLW